MLVSNTDEWQIRHCPSLSCSSAALRVRRDSRHRDVWWVGRLNASGTWSIAARTPCCPRCGMDLEAGVRVEGRVG